MKPANQLSRKSSDVPVLPATVRPARQLLARRSARAALHDLHERLVQRVDGGGIRGLLDLHRVALQHFAVSPNTLRTARSGTRKPPFASVL